MNDKQKKDYINKIYLQSGLTQTELASILGSVQPAVNKLLKGERYPTNQHIAHLKAIELILDKDLLDDLIHKIKSNNE